jgi:DNA-binding transcriptional regulator YdaS (Cro superfamily)
VNTLKILIEHFGSQNKLAIALGVTKEAVSQWFKAGEIPPARAIQIEKLTDGKIKAIDLV